MSPAVTVRPFGTLPDGTQVYRYSITADSIEVLRGALNKTHPRLDIAGELRPTDRYRSTTWEFLID